MKSRGQKALQFKWQKRWLRESNYSCLHGSSKLILMLLAGPLWWKRGGECMSLYVPSISTGNRSFSSAELLNYCPQKTKSTIQITLCLLKHTNTHTYPLTHCKLWYVLIWTVTQDCPRVTVMRHGLCHAILQITELFQMYLSLPEWDVHSYCLLSGYSLNIVVTNLLLLGKWDIYGWSHVPWRRQDNL